MSVTLKQKYDLYKKVRANPDISFAGKVLFEYLLIQCLNCRTLKCHPGRETIMNATGSSLTTVKRVLAELKKAGVLRWRSGRTGWSNEYHFPGLAVTATDRNEAVTERNAVTEHDASDTPAEDQILAPQGSKSAPLRGPDLAPQQRIEHRIEHSPSKEGRAHALPSLKGFDDGRKGALQGKQGATAVPLTSQFYAWDESPQRKAWDAYGRKNGRSYPKDREGGWYFPTEWPPGFEQAA
jgi:hypothetical protein